jgi:ubiquitin carboxyl-terminal hydrolase 10
LGWPTCAVSYIDLLTFSLHLPGNKASATVQPYLLLHLDIFPDAVQTLNDALNLFSAPESLEGYRTAAGKVIPCHFVLSNSILNFSTQIHLCIAQCILLAILLV